MALMDIKANQVYRITESAFDNLCLGVICTSPFMLHDVKEGSDNSTPQYYLYFHIQSFL
jgi:hypothetical protein